MKKIIATACICLLFVSAWAQEVRFGLKGAYNSTWMFNTNISDRGDIMDYKSAFGGSFGLTSSIHFTDQSAVSVDILMATHNAKFKGSMSLYSWEATDKISYIDVPVLFRLGPPDGGGYVEVGPQFSFLSGAKEDYTTSIPGNASYTGMDVKPDFNSMNIAAILGFGYDFDVAENWFISAGLRFGYGLTDATNEFNETEFESVDRSVTSSAAHYDSKNEFNYVATHRAFGGLNVGLIYKP